MHSTLPTRPAPAGTCRPRLRATARVAVNVGKALVSIPVTSPELDEFLERTLSLSRRMVGVPELHPMCERNKSWYATTGHHISLSIPQRLSSEAAEVALRNSLRGKLAGCSALRRALALNLPLMVLAGPDIRVFHSGTEPATTFVVLLIQEGSPEGGILLDVLHCVDDVMAQHHLERQASRYRRSLLHVSIGWCDGHHPASQFGPVLGQLMAKGHTIKLEARRICLDINHGRGTTSSSYTVWGV